MVKKTCMFAVTRQSLPKSTDPKLFSQESEENYRRDLFKSFYVSLGTTTSCICLLKIPRLASFVSFKVIQMV